ncbi:hypothetical protein [Schwartzia succinivorans]|uniref:DUF1574 domain-containing protein n=1 Tax=Schwartzia succinivorans DSM 10502 TaxID=1123243 RepID=A0A1M4XM55_9FIRM|nr:hypothetical protein [Schwartzia succinivorans]SHE94272.1 hypothetical protein SAMN02745190_01527 [Schwartzia succinivorans DSM 10502]
MSSENYVRYFIFIVGGFILFLWGLAWIAPESAYMDREYAEWQSKKEYVRQESDKKEILFLGDSRMLAAVDPTLMAKPGFNLALSGSNPVEMYFTLKNYMENHPKPLAVFVGFAPEHLAKLDAYKRRNFHFHYFTYDEAMESQQQIFQSDGYSKEQQNKELIDDWHYLLRLPTRYGRVILKSKLRRGKEYRKNYQEIMGKFGHSQVISAKENNEQNWEAQQKHFRILNSNDFYLKKILRLCEEQLIPAYILQFPVNPRSEHDIEASGYSDAYEEYMRSIMREFRVSVELKAPVYPADCFRDPSHLNVYGTEIYTKDLINRYDILK